MKPTAICRVSALAVASFFLVAAQIRADNWPQWRGPNNDGVCTETGLPSEWGESKNIVWKLPMPGMGSSTPAIWGDKILFTSEVLSGTKAADLVVMCVSTQGKELWRRKVSSGFYRAMGGQGNNASASPSTDGKHVWFFFGTGELACFDLDGNEVWNFNAQERYGKFQTQWGYHTTPVLYEGKLYVQLLHSGGQWVVALDAATGKEVWKAERKSDGFAENEHSYASPSIWRHGKDALLVTHGNDYTIALRLNDGNEVWRIGDLNPKGKYDRTERFVASPLVTPDLIVSPSAKKGPLVAINPVDAKGLITSGSPFEKWRYKETPDVPSPLLYDGLVYLVNANNGMLTCLDAATGKPQYSSERTHNEKHRASPVYVDGKILVSAYDGVVTVVKPGPKFEVMATNRLPITLTASPVISNGRIYLRGWETLYAISEGGK